jgi:hypothetical protein
MAEHTVLGILGFHIVTEKTYRFLYNDPTIDIHDNLIASYNIQDGSAEEFISWLYNLKRNIPKNSFYVATPLLAVFTLYRKYSYNKENLTLT